MRALKLSPFNERDFLAIEAAVLETDKGRWFLHEFARRNRVADTQTLLNALSRLESNLTAQTVVQSDTSPDILALANALEATRDDISAVRNDMLPDHAEIPKGTPVFKHVSESAHQIAANLIATAEALQSSVNALRKSGQDPDAAEGLDGHVSTLFDGGWRQDVLAQRVAKAMGLLEHLEHCLNATDGDADNVTSVDIPTALSAENLKFFDGDQELFDETPEPEAAPEPTQSAEKKAPVVHVTQPNVKVVTNPVQRKPGDRRHISDCSET